jgi:hypothetical protein
MAVRFVEPGLLKCTGCGASREHLMVIKSHRIPKGKQVLCTEVYRCQECQHQTGTVRLEPYYPTDQAATVR